MFCAFLQHATLESQQARIASLEESLTVSRGVNQRLMEECQHLKARQVSKILLLRLTPLTFNGEACHSIIIKRKDSNDPLL